MGKAKKIGIGIGIFFVIVIVGLVAVVALSDLETAISEDPIYYNRFDKIEVSGLQYKITNIGLPSYITGLGMYSGEGSQIISIKLVAENISKDPKKELWGKSFSLEDSEGRRFTGVYLATRHGDNLGWIQPGLETGPRMLALQIPYDENLEYFLIIENKIVNLGKF